MRTRTLLLAISVVMATPATLASHYDPDNEVGIPHVTWGWAWNAPPPIDLAVEWVGIGGEGGGGSILNPVGSFGDNPGPDDCADFDNLDAVPTSVVIYQPSIALRPPASEDQITEEQSIEDPGFEELCRDLREILWAQDPDHAWASGSPQRVGIGASRYAFDWQYVVTSLTFDDAFRAEWQAPIFSATTCPVTNAVISSDGQKQASSPGDNGIVAGDLNPADCVNDSPAYQETINELQQAWDPGSINYFGGGFGTSFVLNGVGTSAFRHSREELGPGLHVQCLRTTLVDIANSITAVYEDYAYLWIDEAPFLLAPNYLDPGAWDARSSEDHCSDVNNAWPYLT